MNAFIVVDLGFGDAGKGSVVDFLARHHHAHTVLRFNGGAQAAHNVLLPDGRHHTFAQFGSGTFAPGVRTHLSRFFLMDPLALQQEALHLRSLGVLDPFQRLSIDRRALVVSPFQRAANRLRELGRGNGRHGSCGMGIGETMADQLADDSLVLRAGDLPDRGLTRGKLRRLQSLKHQQMQELLLPRNALATPEMDLLTDPRAADEFADLFLEIITKSTLVPSAHALLHQPGNIIFEGAQGVLLDEWFGFHPYTTWSTTTFANALQLLAENNYRGLITRIGVTRPYMPRHGPGPLPTEDPALAARLPEPHNRTNPWQRHFRRGWPDLPLLRYALQIAGGIDQLALTCLDHLPPNALWKVCRSYSNTTLRPAAGPDFFHQARLTAALTDAQPRYAHAPAREFAPFLAAELAVPLTLISHGPTFLDKRLATSPSPQPVT